LTSSWCSLLGLFCQKFSTSHWYYFRGGLPDVFIDRENQLAVLESSQVDWVAVRVSRLTDDTATGSVRAFFGNPSPSMKVTRADLADFMLKQLTEPQWLKQAPIISN